MVSFKYPGTETLDMSVFGESLYKIIIIMSMVIRRISGNVVLRLVKLDKRTDLSGNGMILVLISR